VGQVFVVEAQDLVVQPVRAVEQLDVGHPQAGVVEGQRDGVCLGVAAHFGMEAIVGESGAPAIRILVLACMLPGMKINGKKLI